MHGMYLALYRARSCSPLFFGEKDITATYIDHLDSETPLSRSGTGESRGEDFLGLFRVKGKA